MSTPNRFLETPARGSNVGVWDNPLNANFSAIDKLFGAIFTPNLSSTTVTISNEDSQNAIIRLGPGSISENKIVVLPTVSAIYSVENLTTGNFTVTLRMASGQAVAVPQGKVTQIFTDGTNTKFLNAADPGTFWDYAGSAVPAWINACTVRPWLNCDGSIYNISDYPYLGAILGSTWGGNGVTTFATPDLRNRVRVSSMETTPRLTTAGSGVNGSAIGSVGGAETITLTQANLPNVTLTTSSAGAHTHNVYRQGKSYVTSAYGDSKSTLQALDDFSDNTYSTTSAGDHNHTVSLNGGVTQTSISNVQPVAVFGITLIKT